MTTENNNFPFENNSHDKMSPEARKLLDEIGAAHLRRRSYEQQAKLWMENAEKQRKIVDSLQADFNRLFLKALGETSVSASESQSGLSGSMPTS